MSTPATRKGRRKLGLLATLAAAFGLFLTFGAGNAMAAVGCTYDSATGTVTITVSDDGIGTDNNIVVKRVGEAITVNGVTCLGPGPVAATVLNTDQINVVPALIGADGDDTLTIDETGGRFLPGFTTGESPTTLNEIEWYVNLGGFDGDRGGNHLVVNGTPAADGYTVGSDGAGTLWDGVPVPGQPAAPRAGDFLVNLNAGLLTDDDADVWVVNNGPGFISTATFNLGSGDNIFNGKGGDGTGAPTSLPMIIVAGSGNDDITGGLGSDTITAGGGTDFVDGNGPVTADAFCFQNDVLGQWEFGGSTGDTVDFSGLAGPLTIVIGEDGVLSITGAPGIFIGIENVVGSAGNDTITGNSQGNYLAGGAGNDTLNGEVVNVNGVVGAGDDVLSGGAGNDALAGMNGDDCVIGGSGDDTLNENGPNNGSTTYYDELGGQANGADALDGGSGVDTVDYSVRTSRVVVYLGLISTFNDGADTNADGLSNEFDDVFFTTENVITGSNNDIVSANFVNNRANNVFTDNGGNDCLEGGPGNDSFDQGSAPQGADVQIGNTGSDTSNYSARTAAVAVSLDGVANDGDIVTNEGDNVGGFAVSCRPQTVIVNPPISVLIAFFGPNLSFIENELSFLEAPVAGPPPQVSNLCFAQLEELLDLSTPRTLQGQGFCPGEQLGGDQSPLLNVDVENVDGGSGDDELVGDNTGNVLNGNGGNDRISGNAASDRLNGGDGDDIISPGAGNDDVDGGSGTNTADYQGAGAGGVGVQVNLFRNTASGQGNDTFTGQTIQNVNGSQFDDVIHGDAQPNRLNGRGGEDNISGNAESDLLNGGPGADQITGQTGDDKINGQQGADGLVGGQGNDNLKGGTGKDSIRGGAGNDRLFGNQQPDFLNGQGGNDVCKPGAPGLARGDVVVNCES